MKNRSIKYSLVLILCTFLLLPRVSAQLKSDINYHKAHQLSASVRSGKLGNGFSYYLMKNKNPKNKVSLRFTVKAGGAYEEDHQIESAHWIEHLAVRGTKSFPEGYIKFLENHGLRRGFEINAAATFDYTTYYATDLTLNDDNTLKGALLRFKDISFNINFDSLSMYTEAGAILGEGISMDYHADLDQKARPMLLNHSRRGYLLGKKRKSKLSDFNPAPMIEFYKKWYRPDREAIVIVGDIDLDTMEKQIQDVFSDLKNPRVKLHFENLEDRTNLTGENRLIILPHKEMKETILEIYFKYKKFEYPKTLNNYRTELVKELFNYMIANRLSSIGDKKDSLRLTYANASANHIAEAVDVIMTSAGLQDPSTLQSAFFLLMQEIERARRHGFTEDELKAAKELYLTEHSGGNPMPNSVDLSKKLENYFVSGSLIPDQETIVSICRDISSQLITDSLRSWLVNKDIDIVIKTSKDFESLMPTEEMIFNWMDEVRNYKLIPKFIYNNPRDNFAKIDFPNPKTKAKFVRQISELNLSEYKLSNGVTVLMNATAGAGRVYLRGISHGGSSLYEGIDNPSARYTTSIVRKGGLVGLSGKDLDKYLTSKRIYAAPSIENLFSSLNGNSNIDDFELMLQVLNQYFVSPVTNQKALDVFLESKQREMFDDGYVSLSDTINSTLFRSITDKELPNLDKNQFDINKVSEVYKQRFTLNVSNYTFFISGNFDVDKCISLLNKYLGSLDASSKQAQLSIRSLPVIQNTVEIPFIPETVITSKVGLNAPEVSIIGIAEFPYSTRTKVNIGVLGALLRKKVLERLREKEGGVYGAVASVNRITKDQYAISVAFQVNTKNEDDVKRMILAAEDEISAIGEGNISKEDFHMAVIETKAMFIAKLNGPNFIDYLSDQFKHSDRYEDILDWLKELETLEIEGLNSFLKPNFNKNKFMRFIMK